MARPLWGLVSCTQPHVGDACPCWCRGLRVSFVLAAWYSAVWLCPLTYRWASVTVPSEYSCPLLPMPGCLHFRGFPASEQTAVPCVCSASGLWAQKSGFLSESTHRVISGSVGSPWWRMCLTCRLGAHPPHKQCRGELPCGSLSGPDDVLRRGPLGGLLT